MRVALEIMAVLERPRFALVGINDGKPRSRLAPHCPPLAAGRKASPAKPAQTGFIDDLQDRLDSQGTRAQLGQ